MKQILVNFKIKNKIIKTYQSNKLQWYDFLRKEMQYFEGGSLNFKYQEDPYLVKMGADEKKQKGINSNYRMIPVVEKKEIKKTEKISNNKELKAFFNDYLNYNNTDINIDSFGKDFIICNSPDEEVDDFTYQLERNGFKYRII